MLERRGYWRVYHEDLREIARAFREGDEFEIEVLFEILVDNAFDMMVSIKEGLESEIKPTDITGYAKVPRYADHITTGDFYIDMKLTTIAYWTSAYSGNHFRLKDTTISDLLNISREEVKTLIETYGETFGLLYYVEKRHGRWYRYIDLNSIMVEAS